MPVLSSLVVFCSPCCREVHGVISVGIGHEEAGSLLVEHGGRCLNQHTHPACLDVHDVHGRFTTGHNEWEVFFIKLRELIVSILVDVLGVRVVDSAGDFPIVNKEDMLLTSIEHHFLWCILEESLYSFNFEMN